jgi:hypothetical protein
MVKVFQLLDSKLSRLLLFVSGLCCAVSMFLITADVVGRYFFNSPIPGTLEVTEFSLRIVFGVLLSREIRGEHVRSCRHRGVTGPVCLRDDEGLASFLSHDLADLAQCSSPLSSIANLGEIFRSLDRKTFIWLSDVDLHLLGSWLMYWKERGEGEVGRKGPNQQNFCESRMKEEGLCFFAGNELLYADFSFLIYFPLPLCLWESMEAGRNRPRPRPSAQAKLGTLSGGDFMSR